MASLDDLSAEEHRRRYDALLSAARARAGTERPPAPGAIPADRVVLSEDIPGGWYHALHLRRGEALRVVNTGATPGVALLLWNAREPSERLNMPDTMKVQWTSRLRGGHVLLSDMGRVLAAIIADDCGWHDGLVGGGAPVRAGQPDVRNTRDNLIRAAAKNGLDARDIPPCWTVFAPVVVGDDGRLRWQEGALRPGQSIDLLAAMDLLVALSNCPHPLAPGAGLGAQPVQAIVWRPDPDADAAARRLGPEAARAFANTDGVDA